MLHSEGHELTLVSFNYGQRHSKELLFAAQCAQDLEARHHIVDLSNVTAMLDQSALTNPNIEIPDGHYAEDTMRITVVPNRNAIMLNIAAGLAVSIGAKHVATGVHGGDHYIYPDCRPAFIKATDAMLCVATDGFAVPGFSVLAPFLNWTKGDIAREGNRLGVDFTKTWSCYKGGDIHCGACGTCFERREAFIDAGVQDPTLYETTPEYVDPRTT
jgi:7-cyano-7-deazaguanine synthase